MATTVYLPALTQIVDELNISSRYAELSISLFVIGAALPVIYWGYVAEKYGRKRALYAALVLFNISCVALYFSHSLQVLLVGRMVQGIGAGGAAIIARIIVRDYWISEALAEKLSLLSMAFIVGLSIGQFIGSLLTEYSDWRIGFLLLSFIAVLSLYCVSRLQLKGPDQSSLEMPKPSQHYMSLIKDKRFIVPCIQGGLGFATIVIMQEVSPFVFSDDLGLSGQMFGFFGLVIGFTYFLGSLYVKRVVRRLGSQRLLDRGACVLVAGTLLMLAIWLLKGAIPHELLTFGYISLYLVIIFGQALIFPNSMSLAARGTSQSGAYSIALCGFLQQLIAGLAATFTTGNTQNHSWIDCIAIMGVIIVSLRVTKMGTETVACN
ncbi:MFS transporter [Vibrio profundum]